MPHKARPGMEGTRPKRSIAERLLRGVTINNDTGCWEWNKKRNRAGYGVLEILAVYGEVVAHRISYLVFRGPVPTELLVCHKCNNPPCIRPDHLYLGTPADNTRDMLISGRGNRRYGKGTYGFIDRDEIYSRYINGESATALAAEYDRHTTTITRIIQRERERRNVV